ncbi:hypothetical protein TEA_010191 [Camellia sinensis var. sinensis]|uniref:Uncharacterized protein n=1 Tax=Camellia sinensis var. sinensis TaxID=542762 RepID=A0A4S4DV15_CAMSN|nr:hypothetical protein TEA_010191 [Camellia sinensis var. sinensis]
MSSPLVAPPATTTVAATTTSSLTALSLFSYSLQRSSSVVYFVFSTLVINSKTLNLPSIFSNPSTSHIKEEIRMAGELRFPSIIVEGDLQGVVDMFNVNSEMDQTVAIILDDMIQPWSLIGLLLMYNKTYLCSRLAFHQQLQQQLLLDHHQTSPPLVGPVLLFSTATAINVLGWDGKVRTILSISMPNAGRLRTYFLNWDPPLEPLLHSLLAGAFGSTLRPSFDNPNRSYF